jgi:hypothetical protein
MATHVDRGADWPIVSKDLKTWLLTVPDRGQTRRQHGRAGVAAGAGRNRREIGGGVSTMLNNRSRN